MTCAQLRQDWQKLKEVSRKIKGRKLTGENTMKEKKTESNPAGIYHEFVFT